MSSLLYVAVDDSNNGKKPLIVAAHFSLNPADIIFKRRDVTGGNHKRLREKYPYSRMCNEFFTTPNYRFIVDEEGMLGENGKHLIFATSHLINSFLADNPKNFDFLKIFLDGPIKKEDQQFIKREISIESKVEGVHKKGDEFKYPEICIIADSLTHTLFAYPGLRNSPSIQRRRVYLP